MKITLISTGSRKDKGPLEISKFLEKNNHLTHILYSNDKNLKLKCKNSALIVVSANVSTSKTASQIFKTLKPLNKPLVYAGIYPFLYPNEALKETDLIILKNPKETLLELANKLENFQKISDIKNLWFKATEKEVIKN